MLITLCLKSSQNLQWIGQFNMSHLVQDFPHGNAHAEKAVG